MSRVVQEIADHKLIQSGMTVKVCLSSCKQVHILYESQAS